MAILLNLVKRHRTYRTSLPSWVVAHHQCVQNGAVECLPHAARVDEEWRMSRTQGSLLGEAEDVARRKQLAIVAFRKLSTVWFRRSRISPPLRLRLYDSFVVPVLNMGTWGLTKANSNAWTHTTVAIYARSPAFTGRIASRTRRYIAAVDIAPSAKT